MRATGKLLLILMFIGAIGACNESSPPPSNAYDWDDGDSFNTPASSTNPFDEFDNLDAAGFQEGMEAFWAGNYQTALREFKVAAGQGVADAQLYLGIMYDKGKGVPQDYGEAAKWYRKAAEQGGCQSAGQPRHNV